MELEVENGYARSMTRLIAEEEGIGEEKKKMWAAGRGPLPCTDGVPSQVGKVGKVGMHYESPPDVTMASYFLQSLEQSPGLDLWFSPWLHVGIFWGVLNN